MKARHYDKDTKMRPYEISTPRLAIGTAAFALTAIAMALMVVIPATIEAEAAAPQAATSSDGAHEGQAFAGQRDAAMVCAEAETSADAQAYAQP